MSCLRRLVRGSLVSTLGLLVSMIACKSSSDDGPPVNPDGGTGDCKLDYFCQEAADELKDIRFNPTTLVLAPGETRKVRVYIEPDVCSPLDIPMVNDNASAATADNVFHADGCHAEQQLTITAVAPGKAKITGKFGASTASLAIDVRAKDPVLCNGAPGKGNVAPGGALEAMGAKLAVQAGAALDPESIDPLEQPSVVAPFDATIDCAPTPAPAGLIALGPAITFGPKEQRFLREVVFELPINPALMPATAKLKHLRVQYSSTSLPTPRYVPVANPRIEPRGDKYVFRFEARRLGTYQLLVASDAGTHKRMRTFTHRAVFGFSMGGMGASMFGMNHHDLFDVVAPLGGPMDSTWFLWYFRQYHFGGFCPRKAGDPIPTTPCKADVGPPTEIFEHVQSYENWWHLDGVSGTGGTFPRSEYVDIFRDVSSMWGDPASENAKSVYVAAGVDPPTPFDVDHVDYCSDPTKSTIAKTGYYDRNFNPDGSLPVIKYCDGANQPGKPDLWAPGGTQPMEVTVAVDLNGNGTRDEGEPVLLQAYEPFDDNGEDNLASKDEPGYDAANNPDPAGDDYDFQYNPLGTEQNHHWETKEKFEDVGLDGVVCPSPGTCIYDTGEGDGKYTMTTGLKTFQARDARAQMLGWTPPPGGGAWTDAALDNLDFYSDGGIRDIFNWGQVGNHYASAFAARNRPLFYFNDWTYLPNVDVTDNELFDQKTVDWSALPQATYLRYGNIDATRRNIEKGDGQHVGYPDQVVRRIESALFFVGSRWPDADTKYAEDPPELSDDPDPCGGNRLACTFDFKASDGRTGPTTVIVPPGYWSDASKGLRYPVVYFLHGYGQTPEDLKALVLLVSPLMGQGLSSKATRLQKMIMVFVDGRCRKGDKGPECVNGTFYVNSVRPNGPQIDNYFMDLMKYVDGKFRTMGPSTLEVTD
jgi:hypothetical protein